MLTISLVRHGQSQANAGLATPDPAHVALTPLGHRQAQQVAAFLKKNRPLNLIITSPYLRTKQTASHTRELFPPTTRMEEWDVQEFTFLSSLHHERSTTAERKPLVDLYWEMSEPSLIDGTYPYILSSHSESFKSFIGRVQACIRRLKEVDNKCQNIAVFSHEHFIIAVLWYILHSPGEITSKTMHDFRHFFKWHRLPNGGIVELTFRRSHDRWHNEFITEHFEQIALGPEPPRASYLSYSSFP